MILALDVDGVLLDPERRGAGHWTNELNAKFGVTREELRRAFFMTAWDDVVNGRREIESAMADALVTLGSTAGVEQVLTCWFEADFVPIDAAITFGRRVAAAGTRVVLATNQEHRRAAFLRDRLRPLMAFESMLYSADVGAQKHEATFFEVVSTRLGVERNRREVVFVDDTVQNVERAAACGWTAIHADVDLAWIKLAERAIRG